MPDVTVTSTNSTRRPLRGADAVQAATLALIEHAERALVIYAPLVIPALFNGSAPTRALTQFATRHRHNTVRWLVDDAPQTLRDNDRLMNASRRLRHAFQWHEVAQDDRGGSDMFLIADGRACVYLPDRLRHDGEWAETKDMLPIELQKRFEQLWERSQPAMALSPVGL